jgi:hypothetical protein
MARQNLVSAVLDAAVGKTILEQINSNKEAMPFLINLSKEQRSKFRKMGPKSVDYVNDTLVGAQQFKNSMAKDFPLEEFQKDVDLIKQLYPILVAAQSFAEALSDTVLALGTDCMKEADESYKFLKIAAKTDANAKAQVDLIARRFKRQGNKKKVAQ